MINRVEQNLPQTKQESSDEKNEGTEDSDDQNTDNVGRLIISLLYDW